jgi:TonB family protein
MAEIDKDLIRWKRGEWLGVITLFLIVQLAALILASQKTVPSRGTHPEEPVVALGERARSTVWEEIENPFLFASANSHGFSAEAWLQKAEWKAPEIGRAVPRRFLSFSEAQKGAAPGVPLESRAFIPRHRPAAAFPEPLEKNHTERKSELRVEGLADRRLMTPLGIPLQSHSDILAETVVEALVGADGLVISAHLLEESGSPKADADALALARAARFSPIRSANENSRTPQLGKLIFQWHALDLSVTNNVSNSRSNNVVR